MSDKQVFSPLVWGLLLTLTAMLVAGIAVVAGAGIQVATQEKQYRLCLLSTEKLEGSALEDALAECRAILDKQ